MDLLNTQNQDTSTHTPLRMLLSKLNTDIKKSLKRFYIHGGIKRIQLLLFDNISVVKEAFCSAIFIIKSLS